MICTKEKLAEQVLRLINGGDINYEENLDSREIQLYITQAVGQLVKTGFLQSKGMETGEIDGSLIVTFPNKVVSKDTFGYYVQLPSATVSLMEGRGVHEVGDNGGAFIPTMNGFYSAFKELDSRNLQGETGYYIENGKVRFFNVQDFDDHVVYLKLVAAFDGIDEDEEMYLPLDMQEVIVKTAAALFSQGPQVDKVSDNVDDEV